MNGFLQRSPFEMPTMLASIHQVLSLVSLCRRRASADSAKESADNTSPCMWVKDEACPEGYDDDCKSTEVNDSSDTSGPEQADDISSDDSDNSDDIDLMPNSDASSGDEAESDAEPCQSSRPRRFTVQRRCKVTQRQARVKPQAADLVLPASSPAQPMKKSIRAVINALDDWLASNAAEESQKDGGDFPSQMQEVLQEALAKLSPEDAVMMKTLLDSKLVFAGQSL